MTTYSEFVELLANRKKQTSEWVGVALSVESQKLYTFGYAGMGQIICRELQSGNEIKFWIIELINDEKLVLSEDFMFIPELDETVRTFEWVD